MLEVEDGRIVRELDVYRRPDGDVSTMRGALIAASRATVSLGVMPGTAPATPAAGGSANCVGIITGAEESQLPPDTVGQDASGGAWRVLRLGESLVSPLAREHGANCA